MEDGGFSLLQVGDQGTGAGGRGVCACLGYYYIWGSNGAVVVFGGGRVVHVAQCLCLCGCYGISSPGWSTVGRRESAHRSMRRTRN